MTSEDEVRQLVRNTVERLLGSGSSSRLALPATGAPETALLPSPQRRILFQDDVRDLAVGGVLSLTPQMRLTPLAQQTVVERKLRVVFRAAEKTFDRSDGRVVAIGADHGGFTLKETLKTYAVELGFKVIDVGTGSQVAVDYPDFAYSVASLVAQGQAWRGIMVDGAGIGSCMVANKVPGVRASLCYDVSSAANAREHNDANVLTLGGQFIGVNLAKQIVKTWLTTDFGGGRHARRVSKIGEVEQRFLKP